MFELMANEYNQSGKTSNKLEVKLQFKSCI